MRYDIAPTKTALFDYKDQLSFSQEGRNLLEEKREVLVMQLLGILQKYKHARHQLEEKWTHFYQEFLFLKALSGEESVAEMTCVDLSHPLSSVEMTEKAIMGVVLPSLKSLRTGQIPVKNFLATNVFYDELYLQFQDLFSLLLEVAQLESAVWRLANEIRKTQRKVNALENIFIPEFKEIVKFIADTLEERDRETLFQMKKVKKSQGGKR
ncbi:V-type ATP synthase subunit D [Thermospira aquatica]|uniref:V-type ATP synthase subunit D n=1 Tax=Thermospira aquatica TaxID=2828656 RepID=A0AAX3BDJ1_9SPIR|nr:V-type ATP synthase subunit D [Thermospira aquatica]URA10119.1 V-type ATP synthase subunit D [Thermospira aquatica]